MQDEIYKGYTIIETQGLMFNAIRKAAGTLMVKDDILNAGTYEQIKAMIDHRTRPRQPKKDASIIA